VLLSSTEFDFTDGYLWVFTCSEGGYQQIAAQFIGGYGSSPTDGLRAILDMNSNGIQEIVFVVFYRERDSTNRDFRIMEWNGSRFVDLIEESFGQAGCGYHPSGACIQFGDGATVDVDGDGIPELVLARNENIATASRMDPFSIYPSKFLWYIWDWDGSVFKFSRTLPSPRFRIQAVRDADALSSPWLADYQTALALYQDAIFNESLASWGSGPFAQSGLPYERSRLEAYARFRLMLVHINLGNEDAAEIAYDTLQSRFQSGDPGFPYAAMAKAFWDEYATSRDLSIACGRATEYAAANPEEILVPLGSFVYVPLYSNNYAPEDICPFQ
nr:hypothetical protein [Anaerolineales bacterium]